VLDMVQNARPVVAASGGGSDQGGQGRAHNQRLIRGVQENSEKSKFLTGNTSEDPWLQQSLGR
jgi:hypothetical protein